VLTDPDNLAALIAMPGQWADLVRQRRPLKKLILDMDSSVSPTHGQQEGSRYNGHFGCTCYHPLFVFNQDGDVERAMLRHGNVASADDWRAVLLPVIERYREVDVPKYFRGDAAFAIPRLYDLLKSGATSTRFGSRRTACYSTGLTICSSARWVDRRRSRAASTTASSTKPNPGTPPVAWWPKWSGTQASYSRASGSS
jgi:hypothetical protein